MNVSVRRLFSTDKKGCLNHTQPGQTCKALPSLSLDGLVRLPGHEVGLLKDCSAGTLPFSHGPRLSHPCLRESDSESLPLRFEAKQDHTRPLFGEGTCWSKKKRKEKGWEEGLEYTAGSLGPNTPSTIRPELSCLHQNEQKRRVSFFEGTHFGVNTKFRAAL